MTGVVSDASALIAVLLDNGTVGQWVAEQLAGADLAAPSLVTYEAANIIRRHELAGLISVDQSAQARADLIDLPIEEWPYHAVAGRVTELRHHLTSYDAAYVAVAEVLDRPLLTLDRRLARADGIRCAVLTPSAPAP